MLKSFLLITLLVSASNSMAASVERPPQFVMLAFDGSKNVAFWKESRQFAAANNVRFTYFMSGAYFLLNKDKNNYVEPKEGKGKSAIGFGGDDLAVMKSRLDQVKLAMEEGHEMASHANGHYNGASYSEAMWDSEFEQFENIMSSVWERYDAKNEPKGWKEYFADEVIGFRAPQLGVGSGLWKTLKTYDFVYDTSRVDKVNYWPRRIENDSLWNFPLAGLVISGSGKKTLSMDYNFYVADSKGVDGDPKDYKKFENQMYDTYMTYFNKNYFGNRAPVQIGHHFSKWNGGAYWLAMQRFAKSVCSQPEVICGTYKELVEFVNANKAKIATYQEGGFDALKAPSLLPMAVAPVLSDEDLDVLRAGQNDHYGAHDEE